MAFNRTLIRSTFVSAVCLTVLPSVLFAEEKLQVQLTITSNLAFQNTPFDPVIDFHALIAQAGRHGVLNPNSISVVTTQDGKEIPVAVTEDFSYADRGRLEWVVTSPRQLNYTIRFGVAPYRQQRVPAKFTPPIGTGDLLRFNAGVPRPISLPYLSGLIDLTGDGKADLLGCWNYAHHPDSPWDGIICYPRTGNGEGWEFSDLVRVRYVTPDEPTRFRHFSSIYMNAAVGDLNRDGLPDLVYSPRQGNQLTILLNTGNRDAGGMPVFSEAGGIPRPNGAWEACRIVDLNGDHLTDLVVDGQYFRNTNPAGWPFQTAAPVPLDAGKRACFMELDDDGLLDAICLLPVEKPGPAHPARLAWRKNLGRNPPQFGPAQILEGIDVDWCSDVAAVTDFGKSGILVQHNVFQQVSFFERVKPLEQRPRFRRTGRMESVSAVMSLSDQAWPCLCDWNGDGLMDLLIGGGYGWPRIVINQGTRERAAFAEPEPILSNGEPIRILMSNVYPGCDEYKHNMGYPFPVFTDWDGDGLPDLMLPNCSNRIFWYRNVGSRTEPRFGPQLQLNPVGYEDSPEKRLATGKILMSRWEGELEPGQPFFWRTGAAFADFNSDGLTDLVTHDGEKRKATLFTQFRDPQGELRLKKSGQIQLTDGRLIDDALVGRTAHWTESFRAVDWDGDGLMDLIYSCAGSTPKGSIYLLRNAGTKEQPVFHPPRTLCCFGKPIYVTAHGPHPWVGDFDADGKPDLITCVEWSVYPYYSHAAIEMQERPRYILSPVQSR